MQYQVMKLSDYLRVNKLSLTAFAEIAGLEVSTVHRAATGKVTPSRRTMEAIIAATNGDVLPNDFFDDIQPKGGPRHPEPPPPEMQKAS